MGTSAKTLQDFFARPPCVKGASPLRSGVTIAVFYATEGPFYFRKTETGLTLVESAEKWDMTFNVPPAGLERLQTPETEDIGHLGVEIAKLLLSDDPQLKMKAKVHIGPLEILRNGYLGVIPLGGAPLWQFLREHGFSGIGRIKKAMQNLRT